MGDKLVDGILAVCRVLNQHGVEYLTVGGTAVALHGFYRLSTNPAGAVADKPGLDFLVQPDVRQLFRPAPGPGGARAGRARLPGGTSAHSREVVF